MPVPNDILVKWLAALRNGNEQIAEKLWQQLFPRLVDLAQKKLQGSSRRVNDEEDIALSVFDRMCRNVDRSALRQVNDDDELWQVLVRMTANRIIDQYRSANAGKRGGGKVRGQSVFAVDPQRQSDGLDGIADEKLTPEFEFMLTDRYDQMLEMLGDERLRKIAEWRLEGFTHKEIAGFLGLSERSIERKVAIIKDVWMEITEVD